LSDAQLQAVEAFEERLASIEKELSDLRFSVQSWKAQEIGNWNYNRSQFNIIRALVGDTVDFTPGVGSVTVEPDPEPGEEEPTEFYFSNFLFEWNGAPVQSTMTLLSPYIPDEEKKELLSWYVGRGYNRIHIYFINDENYSGAKGNASGQWVGVRYQAVFFKFTGQALDPNVEMPPVWHSWTAAQELGNALHWLVEARKLGLQITAWLWCNQAADSFNDLERWDDARVLAYNTEIVRQICNYKWDGVESLVDEIVLKLEADDEWADRSDTTNPWRRVNIEVLNRRAAQHRAMIDELGGGQSFWYHNEADNSPGFGFVWDQLDWSNFDGIRIQAGMWELAPEAIPARARELVEDVPEDKDFYWSEYARDGETNAWVGTILYEMRDEWGDRFRGLDNGGGL